MSGTGDQKWTSRSVASRWQHEIFYRVIRLGGRAPACVMLFFVVLYYCVAPVTRRRCRPYLKRRFPEVSGPGLLRETFWLYWTFGLVLLDRAVAGILGDLCITARDEDKELVRDLLSRGRGLVLLTAHMGSWQSVLSALDFADAPKSVVMHRAPGDVDRHFFEHKGAEAPFGIIDPAGPFGGSLEMLAALKQGHMVCGMADRDFGSGKNVVPAPFLGADISLPYSFYQVASAVGSPVAILFSERTGPGQVRVWIEEVLDIPEGLGRASKSYEPWAGRFAMAMERYVTDRPYQYFNFFNPWE